MFEIEKRKGNGNKNIAKYVSERAIYAVNGKTLIAFKIASSEHKQTFRITRR